MIIRRLLLFLAGFLVLCPAHSQVHESFAPPPRLPDSTWTGNNGRFQINTEGQLQLNDSIAGQAGLYRNFPSTSLAGKIWSFFLRQDFAGSSNNYSRFYLSTNHTNFDFGKAGAEGYFLQFGEAGSDDAIALYKEDQAGNTTLIMQGEAGQIAQNFQLDIRVYCSPLFEWSIFSASIGQPFSLEASGTDSTYKTSKGLGVYAQYSSSNRHKFYWDEVHFDVSDGVPLPLLLKDVTVLNASCLSLSFSQYLWPDSLEPENFSWRGIHPHKIIPDPEKRNRFQICFAQNFTVGAPEYLQLENIRDILGNHLDKSSASFVFWDFQELQPGDIIINEIMANPSQNTLAPNAEYIELYNTRNKNFNLSGASLNQIPFNSDLPMGAGSYLIIAQRRDSLAFEGIHPLFLCEQGLSLNNNGESIVLRNAEGKEIDWVEYSVKQQQIQKRNLAGYALERINPMRCCLPYNNWNSSQHPSGGTPGQENSTYDISKDIRPPDLESVYIENREEIQLIFSEYLQDNYITEDLLIVSPSYQTLNAVRTAIKYNVLNIYLAEALDSLINYQLILPGLADCVDNKRDYKIPIGIGRKDAANVIINEVLFDPAADDVAFIELYNFGQQAINLKGWSLASSKNPLLYYPIAQRSLTLMPGDFMALSPDNQLLKKQHPWSGQRRLTEMSAFPDLPRDEAEIFLYAADFSLIDKLHYSEKMQHPMLLQTQGVSLERLSTENTTDPESNWHSAAETHGFSTPGYINSQQLELSDSNSDFDVHPGFFTPNNDGADDVCIFHYQLLEGGMTLSCWIFNLEGQRIDQLADGILASATGDLIWDGRDMDNVLQPPGLYIGVLQAFSTSGRVILLKKSCVLGYKN